MENENKKYLNIITKLSKEKADNELTKKASHEIIKSQNSLKKFDKIDLAKDNIISLESTSKHELNSSKNFNNIKFMTLLQTKDLILDIYKNKTKSEGKASSHCQKETFEQFIYYYFDRKYGLRKMTIQSFFTLIKALNNYSKEDSDVALFTKILKNECNEEYLILHEGYKLLLENTLIYEIRRKYKYKREEEITEIKAYLMKSSLSENIWKSILKELFDESDFLIIKNKIIECLRSENNCNPDKIITSLSES